MSLGTLLALASLPGIGRRSLAAIADAYPQMTDWTDGLPDDLANRLGDRLAHVLTSVIPPDWPERIEKSQSQLEEWTRQGFVGLSRVDHVFPALLRVSRPDIPFVFVRGSVEAINAMTPVAVVGTRAPTDIGVRTAYRLAVRLSELGCAVVSGLAAGIDIAAHRGALDASGVTIAVLGTGVDRIYPAAHRKTADAIVEHGGALISEYPPSTPTGPHHFVERDRVQAALSLAVIAVQTDVKGGTLHTVRFAREMARPVYVPRPAEHRHPATAGIRRLLSEGTASELHNRRDVEEMVKSLGGLRAKLLSGSSTQLSWPPLTGIHDA